MRPLQRAHFKLTRPLAAMEILLCKWPSRGIRAKLLRICGVSGLRNAARFNNSNNNSNNAARFKAPANKMTIQTSECGAAADRELQSRLPARLHCKIVTELSGTSQCYAPKAFDINTRFQLHDRKPPASPSPSLHPPFPPTAAA